MKKIFTHCQFDRKQAMVGFDIHGMSNCELTPEIIPSGVGLINRSNTHITPSFTSTFGPWTTFEPD
ncbi:hypothetical protein L873DRAFT_1804852 [Choiromyces venosus 120613-1]|uniref:Uncharacterized protein n=1 Tax=Choiromyces venosus 120613-1 TaxID=1336337 RepID=A0A3N4K485_9PEZI|nr:hypothetical protein L873DRAFT_1804852 [Choiromyces venosus 120613-1]